MLEGISELIIKQFIIKRPDTATSSTRTSPSKDAVKEITSGSETSTSFSLEELRIPGMTGDQAKHIEYLVKKLLKEDITDPDSKKTVAERKKVLSQEIEKQMDRYVTDKEKELIGILINKLV